MDKDRYSKWLDQDMLAHQMVPVIGELWNRQGIEINVFGKSLVNETPLAMIEIVKRAYIICEKELPFIAIKELLDTISSMGLGLCKIDIGKLLVHYQNNGDQFQTYRQFIRHELTEEFFNTQRRPEKPKDIVLFGFGRIGRVLMRLLIQSTGPGHFFRLRAIIIRGKGGAEDIKKRAELLRHDSIHGPFIGIIDEDVEESQLIINGNCVKLIFCDDPIDVDYAAYGLNDVIVVDNTGKWRDRDGLSKHLQSVVSHVVLTAPAKGDIPNIVFGINDERIEEEPILSCASCTTNAVAPVLKVLSDKFGISHGHLETIHSYTNDQNLLDNYHKSDRRGRAASLNMVITTTGAARAIAKVIPELKGKLTGNSIRVPTPNVSLAILNLSFDKEVTLEELNNFLRLTALYSKHHKQIGYTKFPVVSTDMTTLYSGIVDSQATIVHEKHAAIYVWYDNEFGYSHQVKRVVRKLCGDNVPEYDG